MDQREQQAERPMRREYQAGGDSIGQAKRVIDQLEAKVNAAYRVPMKRDLCIVEASALIDLIGQLRIVLPHTVVQAQAILNNRDEIIEQAKAEADKTADTADKIYTETVNKAQAFDKSIREEADAYDRQGSPEGSGGFRGDHRGCQHARRADHLQRSAAVPKDGG